MAGPPPGDPEPGGESSSVEPPSASSSDEEPAGEESESDSDPSDAPVGRWWLDRLLPRETEEPRTRSGYASDSRRDWWYFVIAIAIGVGFAVLWGWIVRTAPVPPGGDPSTWMLTSYPFVGLPTTTGIQPLAYPPLSFPFVGIAVLLGGGPLAGGRLFMEGAIVGLGVAGYILARTVLERPSLALFAEGLWLAEPDFQQLYYFGGYPNMFALIFLALSLAFFVRYLRSRRPTHIFLFWVFAAICFLAHTLTGTILVGIVILLVAALLVTHRLPRPAVISNATLAGGAVFAGSIGIYYVGTYLLGIPHPVYVGGVTVTTIKSQLLPTVVRPFYLNVPFGAIYGPSWNLSPGHALDIVLATSAGILLLFVILSRLRPHWLSLPWLALASWFLAVFGVTLAGYFLNVPLDYRRIPYFLYPAGILLVLVPVDILLSNWMSKPDESAPEESADADSTNAPPAPRPSPFRRIPRSWIDPILIVVTLAVVVGATTLYTVPSGQSYESFYTLYAHDQNFINAVGAIGDSGVPGNLVTTTPYVAHWPSTLTDTRLTYVPALANGNGYDETHVTSGEITSVTVSGHLTVTNGLVGATLPGIEKGNFNSSPEFGTFLATVYQPILQFPVSFFSYGVRGAGPFPLSTPGAAAPPPVETSNGYGFELVFHDPAVEYFENVTAIPNTDTVDVVFTGVATGVANLTYLTFRIADLPFLSANATAGASAGTFAWTSPTRIGTVNVTGTTLPASALQHVTPQSGSTSPAVVFRENSTASLGDRSLSISIILSSPSATNVLGTAVEPWIDTGATWEGWDVRFLLQYNSTSGAIGTAATRVYTPTYLSAEYGMSLFAQNGPWQVFLMPVTLPL